MAPSVSIELGAKERSRLLDIARQSIGSGLHQGRAPTVDLREFDGALAARRGVFVTLTQATALRGCIGALESEEPLAQAVASSAYGAAFRDPRFPAMREEELAGTRIEISVLSAMEVIEVESREALLASLVPGVDGLLIEDRHHRSTFLPKVWDQLPDPELFLRHLMAKAGLPADHWSPRVLARRYTTLTFAED
jgi:AmmeMemoRadiSam system protein A